MLFKKIESKVDKTTKYIFIYQDGGEFKVEFSYIDNGTNKDIICIPTQTMCNMSCSFCYLTKHVGKVAVRNIVPLFIVNCIKHIVDDLKLEKDTILFSFMASGEPLSEPAFGLSDVMIWLRDEYSANKKVRFAIASILPKNKKYYISLVQEIIDYNLDVKLHLSMHFTNDEVRRSHMPNAIGLKSAISFLDFYNRFTGNDIEIHYTLIKGLNDSKFDMVRLRDLLEPIKNVVTLKFMKLKSDNKESIVDEEEFKFMMDYTPSLRKNIKKIEYYDSVGEDIGSSCGQFFTD